MTNTLVLFGHPHRDSFNGALTDAYIQGLGPGAAVRRIDLSALVFDPVLREGFGGAQPLERDLVAAREAILWAHHLVWVFPTWWVGPPALVRGFIERVFLPGWAFRYRKSGARVDGLLGPRTARVITTMDSPWWWYAMKHRRALHRSFIGGTLEFCGLKSVAETTVYNLRGLDAQQRQEELERAHRDAARDSRRGLRVPRLAS